MHPHSPPKPANSTHLNAGRHKLANHLLAHLHDTELWASYLPRIPPPLYILALLGMSLFIVAFILFRPG